MNSQEVFSSVSQVERLTGTALALSGTLMVLVGGQIEGVIAAPIALAMFADASRRERKLRDSLQMATSEV